MTYLENERSVSEHNERRGGHYLLLRQTLIKLHSGASLSDQLVMIIVSNHDRQRGLPTPI